MILDHNFAGKNVVVVGGEAEAYRKILNFLDAHSKVLVASRNFLDAILTLHLLKKIDLIKSEIKDAEAFVRSLYPTPYLLVAVTNNQILNRQLAKYAKARGCMVYISDDPVISDFIFPALVKIADVTIAVSTMGKSPSINEVLRNRIEKMITEEDLLQIKLENYITPILKQQFAEQKIRKIVLSEIIEDCSIKKLLTRGKFKDAKQLAVEIADSFGDKNQDLK